VSRLYSHLIFFGFDMGVARKLPHIAANEIRNSIEKYVNEIEW